MSNIKNIVVTCGDPASIGPEVCVKALCQFLEENKSKNFNIHLFLLKSLVSSEYPIQSKTIFSDPRVQLYDLNENEVFEIGKGSLESGKRSIADLNAAIDLCLDFGESARLVTGPVHKAWVEKSVSHFTGQTGFLKKKTSSNFVTMLLEGANLKVGLVTTHIPIKEVSQNLSSEKIIQSTVQVNEYLLKSISNPKIAICALNPHASDDGLLGNEEKEIIEPACHSLRQKHSILVDGPFSADTAFLKHKKYDAFICMYHDQALIPLKLLDFEKSINLTLGLPFLRTSVDHGTAFDIAGLNKAEFSSYLLALQKAFNHEA